MEVNYLHMIWDVKFLLAKIKDGKGKDLNFPDKKSLLTKIPPQIYPKTYFKVDIYTNPPPKTDSMNWKEFATNYLHFTKKERLGVIAISLLILIIFFLPSVFSKNHSKPSAADTAWISSIKKIEQRELEDNKEDYTQNNDKTAAYQFDRSANNYNYQSKGELFYFDPNTLTEEGWKKLGLRDKTIHTIQNYVSKGGKFRKPEDLQRIYGLFPNEFERIAPYIKIEAANEATTAKDFTATTEHQPDKKFTPKYTIVDINIADTTSLIALPGIGSKLAMRIITFRDKLGGFYTINQVGETFGLQDSTFQKIKQYLKLENTVVKKNKY